MVMTYGIYGTIDSGIPTPLARDVFGLSFLNAQHSICAQFEINYHRCLEAFGHHLGMRYCDLEYRDFLECTNNTKKKKREEKIRDERMKQFLNGERDRPFLARYPHTNHCRPDYYDKNRLF